MAATGPETEPLMERSNPTTVGVVRGAAVGPHLARVVERLQDLEGPRGPRLQDKVASLSAPLNGKNRKALVRQAVISRTAAQRVHWLRREADLVLSVLSDRVACRRGCSHCCHIGVQIAEGEARLIGKLVGRAVQEPPADRIVSIEGAIDNPDLLEQAKGKGNALANVYFGSPCTFLVDGECGIYEHRPMACRTLFNADDDALLCELVEGESIPVPYVNMQASQVAYMMAWGDRARLADLRDWFPPSIA